MTRAGPWGWGLFIEPGPVETPQWFSPSSLLLPAPPPSPFLLKESSEHRGRKGACHMQKEQPRGHHPVALSTTRVHLGKQPPFPLTHGCSVGGWQHQTRVRMLGFLTVHGHPNKPNTASVPIIPAARKRVQQKEKSPIGEACCSEKSSYLHLSGVSS